MAVTYVSVTLSENHCFGVSVSFASFFVRSEPDLLVCFDHKFLRSNMSSERKYLESHGLLRIITASTDFQK